MQKLRRRLRSFTWLVLTTMLGFALAPTVSHAMARAGQTGGFNPWAEICSTGGLKLGASLNGPGEPGTPSPTPIQAGASHLDHCPLCGHTGQAPMLPSLAITASFAVDGADFLPTLFAQAPRPLFAWAAAQPRGPPALS